MMLELSGGSYVRFDANQNVTPTPTPASNVSYDDKFVPSSIDSTGNTDVTTALNNWVASQPNGTSTKHTRIVFPQGATYMVSRGVNIGSKSHITFWGNRATIRINPNAAPPAQYTSCFNIGFSYGGTVGSAPSSHPSQDIRITGFSCRGNNPRPGLWDTHGGVGWENQAFVMSNGNTNLEIDNNTGVTALGGDFFQSLGNLTSNVHVHDNQQLDSGRQFVSITGAASNILIENNEMGKVGYYFLDIEPTSSGTYPVSDVKFINNTGERWSTQSLQGGGFVAIGDGTNTTWTIDRITISGNSISGTGYPSTEGSSLMTYIGQNFGGSRIMTDIEISNNTGYMTPPSNGTSVCKQTTSGGQNGGLIQVKHVDGLKVFGNKNKGPLGPFLCTVSVTNIEEHDNVAF